MSQRNSSGSGPVPGSFAESLRPQLEQGTAPDYPPGTVRPAWQQKEFAGACGVDARTVKDWLSGRSLPININNVLAALFGTSAHHSDNKTALLTAYNADRAARVARKSRRPEPQATPAASETDNQAGTRTRGHARTIFLSGVTCEFGTVRNEIVGDLASHGITALVQPRFDLSSGRTLQKIDDLIRSSDHVVCLFGKHSGAFPTETEAAAFQHARPTGLSRASYTQWEYLLALHHNKPIYKYDGTNASRPLHSQPPPDDDPAAQAAFIQSLILDEGYDRRPFSDDLELRNRILTSGWVSRREDRPPPGRPSNTVRMRDTRDERLLRLKATVVQTLAAAPDAVDALINVIPKGLAPRGLTGKSNEQRAEDVTILLMETRAFDTAKTWLRSALRSLERTRKQSGLEAILYTCRNLIPWLYIAGGRLTPQDLDRFEAIHVDGVISLPCAVESFAEIIMAGLNQRPPTFETGAPADQWPASPFAVKGQFPEAGRRETRDEILRDDLFKRLKCHRDFEGKPDVEIDAHIEDRLQYYLTDEDIRFYWLCKMPGHRDDAASLRALMDRVAARYPTLAVIELDERFLRDDTRLFDEIRRLLGLPA